MKHRAADCSKDRFAHALKDPASFWTLCGYNGLARQDDFEDCADRCTDCSARKATMEEDSLFIDVDPDDQEQLDQGLYRIPESKRYPECEFRIVDASATAGPAPRRAACVEFLNDYGQAACRVGPARFCPVLVASIWRAMIRATIAGAKNKGLRAMADVMLPG